MEAQREPRPIVKQSRIINRHRLLITQLMLTTCFSDPVLQDRVTHSSPKHYQISRITDIMGPFVRMH